MYNFIHSYLLENNFQFKKELTAIIYHKYLSDVVSDSGKRIRFEVLIQKDNLITISQTLENHIKNSESHSIICRDFYVKKIEDLKYLFSNNLCSEYLLS